MAFARRPALDGIEDLYAALGRPMPGALPAANDLALPAADPMAPDPLAGAVAGPGGGEDLGGMGGVGNVPDAPPVAPVGAGGTLGDDPDAMPPAPLSGTNGAPAVDTPAPAPQYKAPRVGRTMSEEEWNAAHPAEPAAAPALPPGLVFNDPKAGAPAPPRPPAAYVGTVGSDTFQPVSQTRRIAPKLSPEIEAQQAALDTAELAAHDAQTAAAGYAASAAMRARQAADERKAATDAEIRQREAERAADMQRRETDFQATSDAVRQESQIDPNRWWARKSTGDRVLSTIAIALGTLGASLTGGPNTALEMIEREIDRDIESQKQRAAAAKDRGTAALTLYDMARQRYATDAAADAATRQLAYEHVDQQLAAFEGWAKTPEQQAAAQAMRVQMQKRALDAAAQRQIAQQDEMAVSEKWDPKRTVVYGGGSGVKAENARLKAENENNALRQAQGLPPIYGKPGAANESDPLYVAGAGRFKTEKEAIDARKQQHAKRDLIGSLDQLDAIQSDATIGTTHPWVPNAGGLNESGTRFSAQQAAALGLMATAEGSAITDADMPRYMAQLQTPAARAELRRSLQRSLDRAREINVPGAKGRPGEKARE